MSTLSPYLQALDTQIDNTRAEAARTARQYNDDVAAINQNPALSQHGRQALINDVHTAARDRMRALHDSEKQALTHARTELSRRAFGSVSSNDPAAVVAYRDATARAEQVTTAEDATTKLTRALNAGDTELATAIARHALDQGWRSTANVFADAHPAKAQSVRDLDEINQVTNGFNVQSLAAYAFPNNPEQAQ